MVSLPASAPVAAGLNCTVSVAVCFAFKVRGKLAPETLKPVPLTAAAVTCTGPVPVDVSVTVCVPVEATATFPKLRVPGLTVNWVVPAAVPVPFKLTTVVPLVDELLLTVNFPAAAPAAVGLNCTVNVSVCFGFNVAGKVAPVTLKPVPLIVAAVTCTGPVPVDVSVRACVVVEPTARLPKLRLARFTVNCGVAAAVPVPPKLIRAVLLADELLLIVNFPVAAPAAAGLNCTVSASVCFGFKVAGRLAPEMLKPVPLIAAAVTFTGDVPVDVNITDCVPVEPTATFPKFTLPGLTVNCGVVAAVPVPLKLTAVVPPLDELLLTFNLPVAAPAAVGLNCTLNVTVCFGLSVTGRLAPERLNPPPLIVAAVIFTGDVPVDVSVTVCVPVEPTATFPKLTAPGLTASCGVVAAVPVPLKVTAVVAPEDELLLTTNLPVAAPAAVGLNCTFRVTACFEFSVNGKLAPLNVKPLPLIDAAVTFTGPVPVDISVTAWDPVEPTATFPKLRLPGLTANWAVSAAPVPVPFKLTVAVPLVAELE